MANCSKIRIRENHNSNNDMIYRNASDNNNVNINAKGLQQCPQSGLLYAFDIEIETKIKEK